MMTDFFFYFHILQFLSAPNMASKNYVAPSNYMTSNKANSTDLSIQVANIFDDPVNLYVSYQKLYFYLVFLLCDDQLVVIGFLFKRMVNLPTFLN